MGGQEARTHVELGQHRPELVHQLELVLDLVEGVVSEGVESLGVGPPPAVGDHLADWGRRTKGGRVSASSSRQGQVKRAIILTLVHLPRCV